MLPTAITNKNQFKNSIVKKIQMLPNQAICELPIITIDTIILGLPLIPPANTKEK